MLTANESDYWTLICEPERFTHPARVNQTTDSWPDELQWQPQDLKAPAELVWILGLQDTQLNQLLRACALTISAPTLRRIIDRNQRDQAEHALGSAWLQLSVQDGVPGLPDKEPAPECFNFMIAGKYTPEYCAAAYIGEVFTAFGPAWGHSLRQRLAPEVEPAQEHTVTRSTAFGRILWLYESVWPFAQRNAVFSDAPPTKREAAPTA